MQPVVLLAKPTHGLYCASIVQSKTIQHERSRSFYILARSDAISIVRFVYVGHLNLNLATRNSNLATQNSRLEEKKASCGTVPMAALHILIASPTSAQNDFDSQLKLVLIYQP